MKTKDQVRLRERKLKNGNVSLFLETYIDGVRKYEWLKMYLIPETDNLAKQRNEATRRAVETIKARRIIELTNAKAGITDRRTAGKIRLCELMEAYRQKKLRRGHRQMGTLGNMERSLTKAGLNVNTRLANVDKEFCLRYIDYLKRESGLKQTSQKTYFICFTALLNDAERNGLIEKNPLKLIAPDDKIRAERPYREHLTMEEVKRLAETPPVKFHRFKRAFLFSCFCGLRFSDIQALRWGDITEAEDGRKSARIYQQKTTKPLTLPLSSEALAWLPKRPPQAGDGDKVFPKMYLYRTNRSLRAWAERAGIKKHISMHIARHTFATLLVTNGVDLYTISKLLGHTQISTTQIYAEVVDAKRAEAVDRLDKAFTEAK